MGILMVQPVFAAANLSYLDLVPQESIIFESPNANVLRTTLIATNNGNE